MSDMRPSFLLAIGLALSTQAPLAHAKFTNFSFDRYDSNHFASTLQSPAVDTFDNLASSGLPSQISRSIGDYSYTVASTGFLYALPQSYGSPLDPVWSLSTTDALGPLTFSHFSGNASAIGMFIFTTNLDGSLASNNPLNVTATDSKGATFGFDTDPYGSGEGAFFTLTSDANIVSFTVSVLPGHVAVYASVDGLVLGAAPVPEPAAAAQLLAGLGVVGVLGFKSRRRQRPVRRAP